MQLNDYFTLHSHHMQCGQLGLEKKFEILCLIFVKKVSQMVLSLLLLCTRVGWAPEGYTIA